MGHIIMQRLHEVVFDTVAQHAKGLAPAEVAHEVKAVEVEPVGCVDGFALRAGNLVEQLGRVARHAGFVVAEGLKRSESQSESA